MKNVFTDVIGSHEKGCASQLHQMCYAEINRVLLPCETGDEAGALGGLDRRSSIDEALRSIAFAMFSSLHNLMQYSQLDTLEGEKLIFWLELGQLSVGNRNSSDTVLQGTFRTDAGTGSDASASSTTQVIEVDENGNVISREVVPFPGI